MSLWYTALQVGLAPSCWEPPCGDDSADHLVDAGVDRKSKRPPRFTGPNAQRPAKLAYAEASYR